MMSSILVHILRGKQICTNKQLHEITERAFRENTLSCQLVDMLIDKVVVFPDGNVNVTWKAQAPNSLLVDRHNGYCTLKKQPPLLTAAT